MVELVDDKHTSGACCPTEQIEQYITAAVCAWHVHTESITKKMKQLSKKEQHKCNMCLFL